MVHATGMVHASGRAHPHPHPHPHQLVDGRDPNGYVNMHLRLSGVMPEQTVCHPPNGSLIAPWLLPDGSPMDERCHAGADGGTLAHAQRVRTLTKTLTLTPTSSPSRAHPQVVHATFDDGVDVMQLALFYGCACILLSFP